MAKSDIISTVTARIAAATSATPADELATLKVLGTKLGLNTDNIKAQANTASNTASGKDLYDVTLLNQAIDDYLGINVVNLTLPFAVEQGDIIYANEFGSVFNNTFHDIQANAHQKGRYTQNNSFLAPMYNNVFPVDACNYPDTIPSDSYFTLVADNGDLINLITVAANNFELEYFVISDLLKRSSAVNAVSSGRINDNFGTVPTAVRINNIYKTAANTWKIYYTIHDGNTYNKMCYKQFTYTPSSKTFSGVSTNGVLLASTNNVNTAWVNAGKSVDNLYSTYTYHTGTTNTFFIVNNSTSTITEITNTATTTNSSATYVIKDSGNNYFLVVSNSNDVKIASVPGNVAVSVPAAAIPILKYASVKCINAGEFICASGSGKQVRLLKFGAGLTTVTAHTIGTDNTSNGNIITFSSYLKQDNRYYLYSGINNVYSFTWDGTNAPVEKLADGKVLYKYVVNNHGNIDPNAVVITGSCDNSNSNGNYYTKLFTFTQSVLWSNRCAPMFKVNTAAAANISTSVRLFENVVSESSKNNYPNAFGYTKLDTVFDNVKLDLHSALAATGSVNGSGIYMDHTTSYLVLSLNVGFINKPGKYLLTHVSAFNVYSLNQAIKFQVTGSPFSMSTVIETNVPFFIQGTVQINYLGEL